jgi:hypothetical protein
MRLHFKDRPITKERVGWWLRIALTRIFGRKVYIEGRSEPIRLLPWIHRGRLLLMGAEHDFLQIRFSNQYALAIRSAPVVPCPEPRHHDKAKTACHVILCHQAPEVVEAIYNWHRSLSSKYRIVIAYGGSREEFEKIRFDDKVFIEDASLRGPSSRMSHCELLEKAMTFAERPEQTRFFLSEGDLVPLRKDYLDTAIAAMTHHDAGFLAKSIRNITASNNVFLTNAATDGIVEHMVPEQHNGSPQYLHCLGCFFAVDGAILGRMIEQCRELKGLYFEVMFPTAAARAGGRLLSMDSVSDYLSEVRYRPFHEIDNALRLAHSGVWMIHPLRNDNLMEFLRQIATDSNAIHHHHPVP